MVYERVSTTEHGVPVRVRAPSPLWSLDGAAPAVQVKPATWRGCMDVHDSEIPHQHAPQAGKKRDSESARSLMLWALNQDKVSEAGGDMEPPEKQEEEDDAKADADTRGDEQDGGRGNEEEAAAPAT